LLDQEVEVALDLRLFLSGLEEYGLEPHAVVSEFRVGVLVLALEENVGSGLLVGVLDDLGVLDHLLLSYFLRLCSLSGFTWQLGGPFLLLLGHF